MSSQDVKVEITKFEKRFNDLTKVTREGLDKRVVTIKRVADAPSTGATEAPVETAVPDDRYVYLAMSILFYWVHNYNTIQSKVIRSCESCKT